MLVEKIGTAAALEQCAEEASELAQACLKMARSIRGENPTTKSLEELIENLAEETADTMICLNDILEHAGLITPSSVDSYYLFKMNRIKERFNITEV